MDTFTAILLPEHNTIYEDQNEEERKRKIVEAAYLKSRPKGEAEKDDIHDGVVLILRRPKAPVNSAHGFGMLALAQHEASRKRRNKEKKESLEEVDEDRVAAFDDIFDFVVERETQRAIATALYKLLPRYRQVILMRFWGDFTRAEVADQMGISPSAVWRLEKIAIYALRRFLQHLAPRDSAQHI